MDQINIDKKTMQIKHEEASRHHQEAAKYHIEAANFHKADKPTDGFVSADKARGHASQAAKHAAEASRHGAGIRSNPISQYQ